MTSHEFKAWFDGYTESLNGKVPTAKQWSRIKDRIAEIDGNAITERVFIDRYRSWPPYIYQNYPYSAWTATSGIQTGSNLQAQAANNQQINSTAFNSLAAMNTLGHAESLTG